LINCVIITIQGEFNMKRVTTGILATLIMTMALMTTSAFAKEGDSSVDAMFTYGTESFEGLGSQLGATVGAGYEVMDKLQLRLDAGFVTSDKSGAGVTVRGTRIPVDLGVRYLLPGVICNKLTVYGQGALEVSFDRSKIDSGTGKQTAYDTNVGAVVGGGLEYGVTPWLGIGGNVLYHAIDSGYLTLGAGAAFHF
jgi:hypothetical protein